MRRLHTGLAAVGLALALTGSAVAAAPSAIAALRKDEAPALAKAAGAAARKGAVLTLMTAGKPVARFTDSAVIVWSYLGRGVMKTAAGPKTIFLLTPTYLDPQESEESGPQAIHYFDATGRLFWVSGGQFNPAMNVLAESDHETFSVGDYEASFSLEDFSRAPHLKFAFKSNCYVEQWVSDTELKARCPRTTAKGYVDETEALVRQVSPTQWRLTEKALPKVRLQVGPNNPATLFNELVTGAPTKPEAQTLPDDLAPTYKRF